MARVIGWLTLIVVAVLVAGCDGDDDGEQDAAAEAIERAALRSDPGACTAFATRTLLERPPAGGEYALYSCSRFAPGQGQHPSSVEVSEVEVDGNRATANVAYEGSAFDGSEIKVEATRRHGRWRLERIVSFAEFDKDAFLAEYRKLVDQLDALTASQTDCYIGKLARRPGGGLEKALVRGNPRVFADAAIRCRILP